MEWSQLAGKIYAAELRPPEVEKCDQKWGPERSKNWKNDENWELGRSKNVENFRNFQNVTKSSQNAPNVSTSIDKHSGTEKTVWKCVHWPNRLGFGPENTQIVIIWTLVGDSLVVKMIKSFEILENSQNGPKSILRSQLA